MAQFDEGGSKWLNGSCTPSCVRSFEGQCAGAPTRADIGNSVRMSASRRQEFCRRPVRGCAHARKRCEGKYPEFQGRNARAPPRAGIANPNLPNPHLKEMTKWPIRQN
jgi:hypothetical protein